jgi:hypothetical protein
MFLAGVGEAQFIQRISEAVKNRVRQRDRDRLCRVISAQVTAGLAMIGVVRINNRAVTGVVLVDSDKQKI